MPENTEQQLKPYGMSEWHRNVMGTCPVPDCDGEIRSEFNDPLIPSTWNGCCSPECGNWIDGYLTGRDDDNPVALHRAWNLAMLDAGCAQRRAIVQACEHSEWVENAGSYYTTHGKDDEGNFTSQRMSSLRCPACNATKPGAVIE